MKRTALPTGLVCITHFKLFFLDQKWQLALYGQPAQAGDGWIINLPADEVFEGEYSSLPAETLLAADWVQSKISIKNPISQLIDFDVEGYSWLSRAPKLKGRPYEYADLFSDVALACEQAGSLVLALRFMQKALELRPRGPMIRARLGKYLASLQ